MSSNCDLSSISTCLKKGINTYFRFIFNFHLFKKGINTYFRFIFYRLYTVIKRNYYTTVQTKSSARPWDTCNPWSERWSQLKIHFKTLNTINPLTGFTFMVKAYYSGKAWFPSIKYLIWVVFELGVNQG